MRYILFILFANLALAAPEDPVAGQASTNGFLGNGVFAPHEDLEFEKISDVQTTDDTETVIHSVTLPDPSTYMVKVVCEARKSDGTKREAYEKSVLAYRDSGGAAIEGSIVAGFSQAGGTYSFTFGVNGNDLEVKATGVAAETVDWRCTLCNQKLE